MNTKFFKENISLRFKKFSFVTLVNDHSQYVELQNSLIRNGFLPRFCNFIVLDNTNSNIYDGYKGYNSCLNSINSEFVVFVHQDTRFVYDGYQVLVDKIDELNKIDSNWAVAGNAGGNLDLNKKFVRISDPANRNLKKGNLPQLVHSLDENFLLLKKSSNVAFSNDLTGFHFYGTDLCQQAFFRGYTSYVINFHIEHLSSGNKDNSYYDAKRNFIESYRRKMNIRFLRMTTGRMALSGSSLLSSFCNNKHILFLLRKTNFYRLLTRF